MNKLGLVGGLVALGAAFFYAAEKKDNTRRDVLLKMMSQGLSEENFENMQGAMLLLSQDFGHQAAVRNCLIAGVVEAGNIFGHARAIPLLDQIRQYAKSPEVAKRVDTVKGNLNDRSWHQARAREEAHKDLSTFLHKFGFPQMDFGEGPIDVKRQAANDGRPLMTPEQFMKRHDNSDDVSPSKPSLRFS